MTDLSALVGSEVCRLLLDHQVTIFLAGGPTSGAAVSAQIIIDTSFQLVRAEHVDHVDPKRKETLRASCRLLHTTVDAAHVEHDVLTVAFDDGSTLTISPNARSRSWQLVGQGIPHLVAPLIEADETLDPAGRAKHARSPRPPTDTPPVAPLSPGGTTQPPR